MSELKRCPFCGGEAEIDVLHHVEGNPYYVICKNIDCGATKGKFSKTKEEAIKAWNTRIPMQNIVERLEKEGQKMSEAKSMIKYGKASPSSHRYYKAISVKKAIEIVKEKVD